MFLQQSASLAALHTEQTALQLGSSMPGRPPCATIPGELGSNLTATCFKFLNDTFNQISMLLENGGSSRFMLHFHRAKFCAH
jgi:hypothetical protein